MAQVARIKIVLLCLFTVLLSGCYFRPPYNNFTYDPRPGVRLLSSTAIGAGTGAVIGSVAGNTLAGAAIGGVAGGLIGFYINNNAMLVYRLERENIRLINYGDTATLIIPTDQYFQFDSSQLNDRCYQGLNDLVALLSQIKCTRFYVAAFTDDVGSTKHKRLLSQAQADAMVTYLWANNIASERLVAEGFGDKYSIGDNHRIRGSAYNRRIEIQWARHGTACEVETPMMMMK